MLSVGYERLAEDVKILIAKIIEVDAQKIGLDTHFVEELNADSMMALEIMAALEKKYRITIPEDELPKLASLRQVMQVLSKFLPNER